MKQTIVISAFPGTGKTYFCENIKEIDSTIEVLDSDSSKFSWSEPGVRHPDFPNNYIQHIKENIGKVDIIFVSTHKEVRGAMKNSGIKYILVYPGKEDKEEYLERYRNRNSPQSFIDMMNNKWDEFIDGLDSDDGHVFKILPAPGKYLSDVLEGSPSFDYIQYLIASFHN